MHHPSPKDFPIVHMSLLNSPSPEHSYQGGPAPSQLIGKPELENLNSSTTLFYDFETEGNLSQVRKISSVTFSGTASQDSKMETEKSPPMPSDQLNNHASISAFPGRKIAPLKKLRVKSPSLNQVKSPVLKSSEEINSIQNDSKSVNMKGNEIDSLNFIPFQQQVNETLTSCQSQNSNTTKNFVLPKDTVTMIPESAKNGGASFRHGISRYAPYGTRFSAQMKDGTQKTSHIAGDLAARARSRNGKNGRCDLVLVTHDGEREQLDSALAFYESACARDGPRPGPSEVLNHLKDNDIDWDYRKGDYVKLLQRNASNFFKRMMEHARRVQHPLAEIYATPAPNYPSSTHSYAADAEMRKAAAILESLVHSRWDEKLSSDLSEQEDEMDIDLDQEKSFQQSSSSFAVKSVSTLMDSGSQQQNISSTTLNDADRETDWGRPKFEQGSFYYELSRNFAESNQDQQNFYLEAAKSLTWDEIIVEAPKIPETSLSRSRVRSYTAMDADEEFEDFKAPRGAASKKQKTSSSLIPKPPRQTLKTFTGNGAVISSAPTVIRKGREGLSGGSYLKGLSRHSPYGTRFCATMPNGEKRESYLAGDLADRVRTGPGGGELLLVLHTGEIDQLQSAWDFVSEQSDAYQVGAGMVLEHLRSIGKDENHRKPGSALLQKNAGNFFKRVQEFGRRKQIDPMYLSSSAAGEPNDSTCTNNC